MMEPGGSKEPQPKSTSSNSGSSQIEGLQSSGQVPTQIRYHRAVLAEDSLIDSPTFHEHLSAIDRYVGVYSAALRSLGKALRAMGEAQRDLGEKMQQVSVSLRTLSVLAESRPSQLRGPSIATLICPKHGYPNVSQALGSCSDYSRGSCPRCISDENADSGEIPSNIALGLAAESAASAVERRAVTGSRTATLLIAQAECILSYGRGDSSSDKLQSIETSIKESRKNWERIGATYINDCARRLGRHKDHSLEEGSEETIASRDLFLTRKSYVAAGFTYAQFLNEALDKSIVQSGQSIIAITDLFKSMEEPLLIEDVNRSAALANAIINQGRSLKIASPSLDPMENLALDTFQHGNSFSLDPLLAKLEFTSAGGLNISPSDQSLPRSRAGYLYKRSSSGVRSSWSRRFFWLHDNTLEYFSLDRRYHEPTVAIDLRLCAVRKIGISPQDPSKTTNASFSPAPNIHASSEHRRYCFEIVSPGRTYVLQAEGGDRDCSLWVEAISASIEAAILSNTAPPVDHKSLDSSIKPSDPQDFNHILADPDFKRRTKSDILCRYLEQNGIVDRPLCSDDLSALWGLPGNNACADCGDCSSKPDWAGVSLGILLCIKCSGIHRSLSVQRSKVRSLRLDYFDRASFELLLGLGNSLVNSELSWNLLGATGGLFNQKSTASSPCHRSAPPVSDQQIHSNDEVEVFIDALDEEELISRRLERLRSPLDTRSSFDDGFQERKCSGSAEDDLAASPASHSCLSSFDPFELGGDETNLGSLDLKRTSPVDQGARIPSSEAAVSPMLPTERAGMILAKYSEVVHSKRPHCSMLDAILDDNLAAVLHHILYSRSVVDEPLFSGSCSETVASDTLHRIQCAMKSVESGSGSIDLFKVPSPIPLLFSLQLRRYNVVTLLVHWGADVCRVDGPMGSLALTGARLRDRLQLVSESAEESPSQGVPPMLNPLIDSRNSSGAHIIQANVPNLLAIDLDAPVYFSLPLLVLYIRRMREGVEMSRELHYALEEALSVSIECRNEKVASFLGSFLESLNSGRRHVLEEGSSGSPHSDANECPTAQSDCEPPTAG